jgi:hypothetical protein
MGNSTNEEVDGGREDGDEPPLREFGDFVNDVYPKFALLGIIGTVSAFLSSSRFGEQTGLIGQIGVAASLVLPLSITIWVSLKAISEAGEMENPFSLSEIAAGFGYASVATSAIGLMMLVGSGLNQFSESLQLVIEILLFLVIISYYFSFYPADSVRVGEGDSILKPVATLVALSVGLFIAWDMFMPTSERIARSITGLNEFYVLPTYITGLTLTFIIRESLIGLLRLPLRGLTNIRERIGSTWKLRTSLTLTTGVTMIYTIATREVAKSATGQRYGYYEIWSPINAAPAFEVILAHWYLVGFVFLCLAALAHSGWLSVRRVDRLGKVVAFVLIGVILIEMLVIVPNGSHVITVYWPFLGSLFHH